MANKIDKINREALKLNLREFSHQISNGHPFAVRDHVFPVSSKTGRMIRSFEERHPHKVGGERL